MAPHELIGSFIFHPNLTLNEMRGAYPESGKMRFC